MVALTILATVLFPVTVPVLAARPEFADSSLCFAVLMVGIMLSCGHQPFGNSLLMAGHPTLHSVFVTLVVLTNVAANALLIPVLGIVGAATGTALAYVAYVVYLSLLVRWKVGLRL